jgi:4-amino-4-deoxy-L-arabinose transferase-like glycosyltransferase
MERRSGWAFYILLLLGFGIRLHGLTFHSLWLDEAVSVYLASFPLTEVLRQGMSLHEPNPPLYHLALHVWMRVFGSGEAAVRVFSALLGTLYLPPLYLVGRRLFSPRVALVATMLAALNPFLVWYSQEARMYALVATLTLWSLYCLVRAVDTPRWSWWAAYAAVTVTGLYTHLYAVFVLPAQLLYLLLCARVWHTALRRGVLAWTVSFLCFVPWLWRAWELSGTTPSWRPPLGLGAMLVACLESFTVRRVPLSGTLLAAALFILALIALSALLFPMVRRGGARLKRRKEDYLRPTAFLALTLAVPFLSVYVLSFRLQIFTVYYLIIIVAPFLLAMASGLDKVASAYRWAGVASALLAVGLLSYGLCHNWSLEYRKEEWRAAARYVEDHARQGDAVLSHVEYTRIPFSYYYRGDSPVFAPFGGRVGGGDEVSATLAGLGDYDTVWLVQSHTDQVDPDRAVESWLAHSFPLVTEQYPPGVEIKGYAVRHRLGIVPLTAHSVDAIFGEGVRLAAYEIDGVVHAATDDTYHPPSGWIHVTLYWEALVEISGDYSAVVRMTDDAHQVWGGSLERATGAMQFYPSSSWVPGEIVRDDHDVNLNPQTPTGEYNLEVRLFTASGEELLASHEGREGAGVHLGQVTIAGF